MDLKAVLRDKIKPELNKLYTSAPGLESNATDWGWFCREHAFHCCFLCRMLSLNTRIKRGDFMARKQYRADHRFDGISSYNSENDHAWCEVAGIVPVDLSVNFEYFSGEFPWIDLVFGAELPREYTVAYTHKEVEFREHLKMTDGLPRLSYLERDTVDIPDDKLLTNPYAFLIRPPRDALGDIYGNDIFNKITMHLYKLATGNSERMTIRCRGMRKTLPVLNSRHPNATDDITKILAISGPGGCLDV